MKTLLTNCVAAVLLIVSASAAENTPAKAKKTKGAAKGSVKLVTADLKTAEHIYKKTPQAELKLHFHFPPGWKADDKRPAILFFFGGGWRSGTATQFLPQAEYFATRGLVTVRADYRIFNEHKTTPDIATEDAKSALRWLRGHAAEFGIDPAKIIASGGSAGGHLAAATLLVEAFDAPTDDLKISAKPNALVLFNPALNLTLVGREIPGADGKNVAKEISPTVFLTKPTVPTIIFFGDADALKAHGDEFLKKASGLGTRCEQWVAPGQPHGFFNREPWTSATAIQADRFLASLGYLQGAPTLKPADANAKLQPQTP
jgi:acetyl esterase/lipase